MADDNNTSLTSPTLLQLPKQVCAMLFASLLPLLALASASPVVKRYAGVQIVSGRNGQCLGAAPNTEVGSQVQTVDCGNTTWATLWDIDYGSG